MATIFAITQTPQMRAISIKRLGRAAAPRSRDALLERTGAGYGVARVDAARLASSAVVRTRSQPFSSARTEESGLPDHVSSQLYAAADRVRAFESRLVAAQPPSRSDVAFLVSTFEHAWHAQRDFMMPSIQKQKGEEEPLTTQTDGESVYIQPMILWVVRKAISALERVAANVAGGNLSAAFSPQDARSLATPLLGLAGMPAKELLDSNATELKRAVDLLRRSQPVLHRTLQQLLSACVPGFRDESVVAAAPQSSSAVQVDLPASDTSALSQFYTAGTVSDEPLVKQPPESEAASSSAKSAAAANGSKISSRASRSAALQKTSASAATGPDGHGVLTGSRKRSPLATARRSAPSAISQPGNDEASDKAASPLSAASASELHRINGRLQSIHLRSRPSKGSKGSRSSSGVAVAIDADAGSQLVQIAQDLEVLLYRYLESSKRSLPSSSSGSATIPLPTALSAAIDAASRKLIDYFAIFDPSPAKGARGNVARRSMDVDADDARVRPEALLVAKLMPHELLSLLVSFHRLAGRPNLIDKPLLADGTSSDSGAAASNTSEIADSDKAPPSPPHFVPPLAAGLAFQLLARRADALGQHLSSEASSPSGAAPARVAAKRAQLSTLGLQAAPPPLPASGAIANGAGESSGPLSQASPELLRRATLLFTEHGSSLHASPLGRQLAAELLRPERLGGLFQEQAVDGDQDEAPKAEKKGTGHAALRRINQLLHLLGQLQTALSSASVSSSTISNSNNSAVSLQLAVTSAAAEQGRQLLALPVDSTPQVASAWMHTALQLLQVSASALPPSQSNASAAYSSAHAQLRDCAIAVLRQVNQRCLGLQAAEVADGASIAAADAAASRSNSSGDVVAGSTSSASSSPSSSSSTPDSERWARIFLPSLPLQKVAQLHALASSLSSGSPSLSAEIEPLMRRLRQRLLGYAKDSTAITTAQLLELSQPLLTSQDLHDFTSTSDAVQAAKRLAERIAASSSSAAATPPPAAAAGVSNTSGSQATNSSASSTTTASLLPEVDLSLESLTSVLRLMVRAAHVTSLWGARPPDEAVTSAISACAAMLRQPVASWQPGKTAAAGRRDFARDTEVGRRIALQTTKVFVRSLVSLLRDCAEGAAVASFALPASAATLLPSLHALSTTCIRRLTSEYLFEYGPLPLQVRTLELVTQLQAGLQRAAAAACSRAAASSSSSSSSSSVTVPAPSSLAFDLTPLEFAVTNRTPADWRTDATPGALAQLLDCYADGILSRSNDGGAVMSAPGLQAVTSACVAGLQRGEVPPYGRHERNSSNATSRADFRDGGFPSLRAASRWWHKEPLDALAQLAAASLRMAQALHRLQHQHGQQQHAASFFSASEPSAAAAVSTGAGPAEITQAWLFVSDLADAAITCLGSRLHIRQTTMMASKKDASSDPRLSHGLPQLLQALPSLTSAMAPLLASVSLSSPLPPMHQVLIIRGLRDALRLASSSSSSSPVSPSSSNNNSSSSDAAAADEAAAIATRASASAAAAVGPLASAVADLLCLGGKPDAPSPVTSPVAVTSALPVCTRYSAAAEVEQVEGGDGGIPARELSAALASARGSIDLVRVADALLVRCAAAAGTASGAFTTAADRAAADAVEVPLLDPRLGGDSGGAEVVLATLRGLHPSRLHTMESVLAVAYPLVLTGGLHMNVMAPVMTKAAPDVAQSNPSPAAALSADSAAPADSAAAAASPVPSTASTGTALQLRMVSGRAALTSLVTLLNASLERRKSWRAAHAAAGGAFPIVDVTALDARPRDSLPLPTLARRLAVVQAAIKRANAQLAAAETLAAMRRDDIRWEAANSRSGADSRSDGISIGSSNSSIERGAREQQEDSSSFTTIELEGAEPLRNEALRSMELR